MTASETSSLAPNPQEKPLPAPGIGTTGFKISAEMLRTPRSTLYKARRMMESDTVVLKVFRRNLCDRHFIEKLAQNAEAAFTLQHSGLVRSLGCIASSAEISATSIVSDAQVTPVDPLSADRILLISEFVQGDSIARLLKDGKAFMPSRALLTTLQCANALQYAAAHKHFHGRLHPADILLGGSNACILGVGLGERPEHPAWDVKDPYLFEPLIYTPPEAMPSQNFPENPLKLAAVDIYQLGAILFHMLTGLPPFKGRDELSLVAERAELKKPVHWPAKMNLSDEAVRVTEKMLSPVAEDRPRYEDLIPLLTDALFAAEKTESSVRQEQAAASPQFAKAGAAPLPKDINVSSTAVSAGSTSLPKMPEYEPILADTHYNTIPRTRFALFQRDARKNNGALSWALVALTAMVFMLALVEIIFRNPVPQSVTQPSGPSLPLPPPQTQPPVKPGPVNVVNPPSRVQPPPVASMPAGVAPITSTSVASGSAVNAADRASAAKQFELVGEMLKRGEIKPSAALLRMLKNIAEDAGKDTSTGLKAMLLAAEIEDTLIKNLAEKEQPAAVRADTAIPNKVEKAEKADESAEKAAAAKKILDDKAAEEKTARAAEELAQKKLVLAGALKRAREKSVKFQYGEALDELDKLTLGEELQKSCAAANELLKLEQDFFLRCRKHLGDEIERSPLKESPLQVFPRKNDPIGDDIVDFDSKGLVIQSKKGSKVTKRVTEWEKVPPEQALVLLQLLSDKRSVEDQSALATFAFHRNLPDRIKSALETLRSLPNGKDKANTLLEVIKNLQAVMASSEKTEK